MPKRRNSKPKYSAAAHEQPSSGAAWPELFGRDSEAVHLPSHRNLVADDVHTAYSRLTRTRHPATNGPFYEYAVRGVRLGVVTGVESLDSGTYIAYTQERKPRPSTSRILAMDVPGIAKHDTRVEDTCAALLFGLLGVSVGESKLPRATYMRDLQGRKLPHRLADPLLYATPTGTALILPSEQAGLMLFAAQTYPSAQDAEAAYGRMSDIRYVETYSGTGPQKLDMSVWRRDVDLKLIGGLLASLAADVEVSLAAAKGLSEHANTAVDTDYRPLARGTVDLPSL